MARPGVEIRELAKDDAPITESSEDDGSGCESEENTRGNAGWADSIAKVLNTTKPKTKKTIVLSRAKKLTASVKIKPEERYGFQVDGEVKKDETTNAKDEKSKQRKNQTIELRVKPSWKEIERERALRKVATRGVVQLFNAVRMQQKDLQQQLRAVGPLDHRKDAVLNNIDKRKFLDVLMTGKRAKSDPVDNEVKSEGSSDDEPGGSGTKKAEWDVFKEDYMTNKKIKHWDEEGSGSEQHNSDKDESDMDEN